MNLNTAFVNVGTRTLSNKIVFPWKTVNGYNAASAATDYTAWLYEPFSSSTNDVQVAESQNTTQWQVSDVGGASVYGVSGGIQSSNDLLTLAWMDDLGDMWYLTDYNFMANRL